MEQIIKLNSNDIAHLIAKEFNAKDEQVSVYLEKVYRGYGLGEHEEYVVAATIRK